MENPFGSSEIGIGMKIGQELGSSYLNKSSEYLSFLSLNFLKPYFNINNKYVYRKIKFLLLPFLYKEPELQETDDFEDNPFEMGRSKIEFPDLYIPTISFISFLLLTTFNFAITSKSEFHPEHLGSSFYINLFIWLMNVIVIKACKRFIISIICILWSKSTSSRFILLLRIQIFVQLYNFNYMDLIMCFFGGK